MKLKSLILGSTVALALVSGTAFANSLNVSNTTGLYSAVKAPVGCSTSYNSNAWTGPGHTTSTTPWSEVTLMCLGHFPCSATLYLGGSSAKSCNGGATTTVKIASNGQVTANSSTLKYNGNTYHLNAGSYKMSLTK